MIYDKPCSQYLTSIAKSHERFKIKVTARTVFELGNRPVVGLKGFGISPINQAIYHNFVFSITHVVEWFLIKKHRLYLMREMSQFR
jgi:hypothetical protein